MPISGTEQETREGYNLLKLDFDNHKNYVSINDDGSFDVKNTSTGNIYLTIQNISLQAGTYTFLYEKNSNMPGIFIQRDNDGAYNFYLNSDVKYKQFTFDEDGVFRFEMLVGTGEEIKNVKLMLLKGAYTFDNQPTYEPYGAMPSPDYPSEIVTVGQNGSVEIEVCNKNLAKINEINWELTENNTIKNKAKNDATKLATISLKKVRLLKFQ